MGICDCWEDSHNASPSFCSSPIALDLRRGVLPSVGALHGLLSFRGLKTLYLTCENVAVDDWPRLEEELHELCRAGAKSILCNFPTHMSPGQPPCTARLSARGVRPDRVSIYCYNAERGASGGPQIVLADCIIVFPWGEEFALLFAAAEPGYASEQKAGAGAGAGGQAP